MYCTTTKNGKKRRFSESDGTTEENDEKAKSKGGRLRSPRTQGQKPDVKKRPIAKESNTVAEETAEPASIVKASKAKAKTKANENAPKQTLNRFFSQSSLSSVDKLALAAWHSDKAICTAEASVKETKVCFERFKQNARFAQG